MNLLCWNTRGMGSLTVFNKLQRLVRCHSPKLVFLSETKLWGSKTANLRFGLGFDSCFHVDHEGSSGSLVLLWNNEWIISVKSFSKHHIDALITNDRGSRWRFTRVYGHCKTIERIHTWEVIRHLNSLFDLPWQLGGDFNEILGLSEKKGGSASYYSSMFYF
ncbi:Endonuclease/exonuclease/phosphatase [Parasponia andersonii]|uniref:Endonuclease/exonuclease/phosphatase n=1 Tax=Parasponia andersonii TaxID=3476 RepID=A0A2P5AZQ9_PARAD|nr:Endonuclease/exonuclease/phosphatase [Parasponia andersonii]